MGVFSRGGMGTVGERLRRGWWEGVLGFVLRVLLLLGAWGERVGAGGGREVLLLLGLRIVCLPSSHWHWHKDSLCCSIESAIRHFSARGRVALMPGLDLASLTSCSSLSWTSTNRAQEGRRRLVGGSAWLLPGKLKTASTPWCSLASSPFADFICFLISLATSGGAALACPRPTAEGVSCKAPWQHCKLR